MKLKTVPHLHTWSHFHTVLITGAALAYPLLVFLGLSRLGVRWIGLTAALLVGLRFCLLAGHTGRKQAAKLSARLIPLVLLWLAASITEDKRLLLLVPGLGSLYMSVLFMASLRPGHVNWIERLARLIHGTQTLAPTAIRHCRRVTILWAGFLFLNGLVSGALALYGPLGWWTLYTGLLAYILMGVLMAAEYLYRILRVRPIADAERSTEPGQRPPFFYLRRSSIDSERDSPAASSTSRR